MYTPLIAFMAGIGGSLHCIGMCGGLVAASCQNTKDVWRYQLGRLVGYTLLGSLAGLLGSSFQAALKHLPMEASFLKLIPSLFIGALFIYWGWQSWRGQRSHLPAPRLLTKTYQKLWKKWSADNASPFSRSWITGLLSLLLPCGLLYSVILAAVALQNFSSALLAVTFFWLGTLPAMVLAPDIFQRLLRPFQKRNPKIYALSLVLIGTLTIALRLSHPTANHASNSQETPRCH